MDAEGRLYFRGRSKDVIVTPEGLNVSPDDVERELRRIPQIKDCVVVSIADQVHAALIIRNPGSSRQEIEGWIRDTNGRLESHQRIRNWSIWPHEDFPRTTSTQKIKAPCGCRTPCHRDPGRKRRDRSVCDVVIGASRTVIGPGRTLRN
jgi:long-chain acyl-CoA synthetase